MNTVVDMRATFPDRLVIRRLCRNLSEIDRLFALLAAVVDGYRFTNRLNEAVLLVPEDVLTDVCQALGTAPETLLPQETR